MCGVVIVNFRSSALLPGSLGSLEGSALPVQPVVVDNLSDHGERELAAGMAEAYGAIFVPMPKNMGFGAGCNAGAEAAATAGATSLLFLNPDARLVDDALVHLAAAVADLPAAMVSPRIVRPDGTTWFAGGALDHRNGIATHGRAGDAPDWLSGCALFMTLDTWRRVEGFDERFFLYWEDVELSVRWRRAGGLLRLVPGALVEHDVGGTQGRSEGKSSLYFQHNLRSRFLYLALDGGRLSAALRGTIAYVRLLRRRGLGAGSAPATSILSALRGSASGLLLWARVRTPAAGHRSLRRHHGAGCGH